MKSLAEGPRAVGRRRPSSAGQGPPSGRTRPTQPSCCGSRVALCGNRVPLPLALVGTGFNPRPARLSEHPEDDSLDVVPSGVSKVSEFDTIDTDRHDPHISPV